MPHHPALWSCLGCLGNGSQTQFVAATDMPPGKAFGLIRITSRNGGHEGRVLGACLRDASWHRESRLTEQGHCIVQVLQAFQQKAVMGGPVELLVENRVFPCVHFGIVRKLAMSLDHRLKDMDFGRICVAGRQCCGSALQAFPNVVELGHGPQVMLRHGQSTALRMHQHPIRLQPPQRLANRGSADLQPGAEIQFGHPLPRLQNAFLYRVAQRLIRLLGKPSWGSVARERGRQDGRRGRHVGHGNLSDCSVRISLYTIMSKAPGEDIKMRQHCIRAVFMRGGTSNALVFHRADLPEDRAFWAPIFLSAMGSPDPNGRQLDGMGGGVSSLSKVCVVGPPSRPDADVDYTFAQISVGTAVVDYSANCGNMSSAIGPFALDEGLVPVPDGPEAVVRIHNTNTSKIIVSRFPVDEGKAAVEGDFVLDGVAGSGAAIRLEFQDPGGARTGKLLKTGHASDVLDIPGSGPIEVSMVDAANPCVFVAAASVGMTGIELPPEIEKDTALMAFLEAIRCHASVAMGLAPSLEAASRVLGVPKVAMVAAPTKAPTLSSRVLAADEMDILIRMISIGQPHRAVPLTGALCLAAACRVPGSVAWRLLSAAAHAGPLRIGHPSGVVQVDADVEAGPDEGVHIRQATVYRTARRMFQGEVLYRTPSPKVIA